MKRFSLYVSIATTITTSIFAINTVSAQFSQRTKKPNIIFILVDDLGYGDLSCYGQKELVTPRIDKMASEGIRFTNFYTGSAVCSPSRASLMSGKHTGHCSVRSNQSGQILGDNEQTLAKVLKSAGYICGIIGKWGVGEPPPTNDPQRCGFDYSYGYLNMYHAHNSYPEFLYRNGEKIIIEGNKLKLENGVNPWARFPEGTGVSSETKQYSHYLFDAEALRFIEENKQTPFFLHLNYTAPHSNNERRPDGMETPTYFNFESKEWPSPEKGFASMVKNIDNSVGMILDEIRKLNLDENTIVFFASDNGPHQEGGHSVDFFDSNGSLKGKKRDVYEGGIRTPFIVWSPSLIAPNSTSDFRGAFWDILPTFCELVHVKPPKETDGISIVPTLTGQLNRQKEHKYLYWEFYDKIEKQAVVFKNFKGVLLGKSVDYQPLVELYDLSIDESEKINIADQYPAIVSKMKRIMNKAHTPYKFDKNFEEK